MLKIYVLTQESEGQRDGQKWYNNIAICMLLCTLTRDN